MKSTMKRATVYLDPELHRALKIKAAQMDRTVSDLVNEAVKYRLSEDEEDLSAFEERVKEPDLLFQEFLKDMKRRGKI